MDDASAVSSPAEDHRRVTASAGDGHRVGRADGGRGGRLLAHGKLYATTVGSTAAWPTAGAKLARKFDVL